MKFSALVGGASAYVVGMQSAPVEYAPVQYAPSAVQYASPQFLAPNSGVPMMVVDQTGQPMYQMPYEQQPASSGNMGVLAALCGLGAVTGYALGRNQAVLGVMGKPARAVRRAAVPMMSDDDIMAKLAPIIAEQLGVDAEKVTPDANFTTVARHGH
jgi:hypothetical protein